MADYLKFSDAEITNQDQQPSLHMHWGWSQDRKRNQWLWDSDVDVRRAHAAAEAKRFALRELEAQQHRAMREVVLALVQHATWGALPPALQKLQEVDVAIKNRRELP